MAADGGGEFLGDEAAGDFPGGEGEGDDRGGGKVRIGGEGGGRKGKRIKKEGLCLSGLSRGARFVESRPRSHT